MKFVFVENRYKTLFLDVVAKHLRDEGHSIAWVVQNPVFKPTTGDVKVVAFPRAKELSRDNRSSAFDFIRRSDRNLNYFGGNDSHYAYYQRSIDDWLDATAPDVVVGESTLFHELMAVDWCKRNDVPFLHPTMPGYPGGSFTVFSGDSKTPLVSNDQVPTDVECLAIAEAIRRRERIPEYMITPSKDDPLRVQPNPRSMGDRLKILRGYLSGERFNTPSPWVKWRLDREVRRRLGEWSAIADERALASEGKRVVLYPLQMQPEANLDVWGQTYRDQAALVRALADALPEGWHLRVKANPKAKYEVSSELISVLRSHPQASPLALQQDMANAMRCSDLLCTVTGTVAVECVLSRKPLAQLGPSIVRDGPGCIQLSEPADIVRAIRKVESGSFPLATDLDRTALVRELYATTYPGLVSDPSNLPGVMRDDNCRRVAATLVGVVRQCV